VALRPVGLFQDGLVLKVVAQWRRRQLLGKEVDLASESSQSMRAQAGAERERGSDAPC
jgi:hypothetical protein